MALSLLAAAVADAEPLKPIPAAGSPLSILNGIGDVHEARSDTDTVRAYYVSLSNPNSEVVLLQARSDNRPPDRNKSGRVFTWNLGGIVREIRGIKIEGTTVRLHGWSYSLGEVTCTYVLQFKEGVLTDTLDAKGCVK
jgi:hypothetical protein